MTWYLNHTLAAFHRVRHPQQHPVSQEGSIDSCQPEVCVGVGLPLVSLKDEHESQGEARGSEGHEQHACPVVPQGKHLAGGVDVGPHHHVEHL